MGFPGGFGGFSELAKQQTGAALGSILPQPTYDKPIDPGSFIGGSGGGGGGGGASVLNNPAYWSNLQKLQNIEQSFLGTQEELARKGFTLSEAELQQRRSNLQRMLDLLQRRLMGQELPTTLRQIGNEAAARGSFMSQARILGQQEARTAAQQRLKEAQTEAEGQTRLMQIDLQQQQVRLDAELARLSASRQQSEVEYQNVLLRKP